MSIPAPLTITELASRPDLARIAVRARSDEQVVLRLLKGDDVELLTDYFLGLGEATREVYAPHPFDRETARLICSDIDYTECLRLVAVRGAETAAPRIVGYFIVVLGAREGDLARYRLHGIVLDEPEVCTLAPSVADAWQDQGIGSLMLTHLIDLARRLGKRNVILMGGVREENRRAVHFYRKFGFRKLWEFQTRVNNYDMMLELSSPRDG